MNILEAMLQRHSIRKYTDKFVERSKIDIIKKELVELNKESGLIFGLNTEEPNGFEAYKPSYHKFVNAKNYITIIGKRNMEEAVGYYGEKLVLFLIMNGLKTCWTTHSYNRIKIYVNKKFNEKLYAVIVFGYSENDGYSHRLRDIRKISNYNIDSPKWFKNGLEGALLAPTRHHKQRFYLELKEDNVVGIYVPKGEIHKIEYGIIKYHFEQVVGIDNFKWEYVSTKYED